MKFIKTFLIVIFFFIPFLTLAQESKTDTIFKAEVIEIIKEQTTTLADGSFARQQNIKLKGLENEFKDVEVVFEGIGSFDVIKKNIYHVGDKVLVLESINDKGVKQYYITDYIRNTALFWLSAIFLIFIISIGGWKGLRSVFSLIATFLIIILYLIPQILNGANPIIATFFGSFVVLLIIIYGTEGFKTRSHIAVLSILTSLIITIAISSVFVWLSKLSGLSNEESGFLISLGLNSINFKGLLLAGIIIGTLGVLDDIVIAQVATVEQLINANRLMSAKETFKKAYDVGVSHISSMTNTLFLAYAGVSMPLLVLFASGHSAFSSFGQLINNEQIATEIVRTLSGSVGLILAVPISTILSVWWFKKYSK